MILKPVHQNPLDLFSALNVQSILRKNTDRPRLNAKTWLTGLCQTRVSRNSEQIVSALLLTRTNLLDPNLSRQIPPSLRTVPGATLPSRLKLDVSAGSSTSTGMIHRARNDKGETSRERGPDRLRAARVARAAIARSPPMMARPTTNGAQTTTVHRVSRGTGTGGINAAGAQTPGALTPDRIVMDRTQVSRVRIPGANIVLSLNVRTTRSDMLRLAGRRSFAHTRTVSSISQAD